VRRQHAQFYLRTAEEPPRRFDVELDNYRAVLTWALESGEAEVGLRLGAALGGFCVDEGVWAEGRERLEKILALEGASERTALRARALEVVGWLAKFRGDIPTARAFTDEGLGICREVGDRLGAARCQILLGNMACWDGGGGADVAQALFDEALAVAQQLGDRGLQAHCLNNIGMLAHHRGDGRRAEEFFTESLELYREVGATNGVAELLAQLASVASEREEYRKAAELCRESLATNRSAPTPFKVLFPGCLARLGEIHRREGRLRSAVRLWGAASRIADEHGFSSPKQEHRIAATRAQMGEEAFDIAWQEGRAMTLDEAIEYALEEGADA
jgi:tetratricopeptide (TPR) repeat protein